MSADLEPGAEEQGEGKEAGESRLGGGESPGSAHTHTYLTGWLCMLTLKEVWLTEWSWLQQLLREEEQQETDGLISETV